MYRPLQFVKSEWKLNIDFGNERDRVATFYQLPDFYTMIYISVINANHPPKKLQTASSLLETRWNVSLMICCCSVSEYHVKNLERRGFPWLLNTRVALIIFAIEFFFLLSAVFQRRKQGSSGITGSRSLLSVHLSHE